MAARRRWGSKFNDMLTRRRERQSRHYNEFGRRWGHTISRYARLRARRQNTARAKWIPHTKRINERNAVILRIIYAAIGDTLPLTKITPAWASPFAYLYRIDYFRPARLKFVNTLHIKHVAQQNAKMQYTSCSQKHTKFFQSKAPHEGGEGLRGDVLEGFWGDEAAATAFRKCRTTAALFSPPLAPLCWIWLFISSINIVPAWATHTLADGWHGCR